MRNQSEKRERTHSQGRKIAMKVNNDLLIKDMAMVQKPRKHKRPGKKLGISNFLEKMDDNMLSDTSKNQQ